MKQNCHFQKGKAQQDNAAMHLSFKDDTDTKH